MPSPFFSGRIPQELKEKIDEFCKKTGKGKTEFMIEAFYKYLDLPIPTTEKSAEVTKEMYEFLVKRIERLEADKNITSNTNIDSARINNEDFSQNDKCDNTNIMHDNIIKDTNDKERIEEYKSIYFEELKNLAKISVTDASNLKAQVKRKAKKREEGFKAKVKFNPPIEMVFEKGININNKKFNLFCKGVDENTQPIWELHECDNTSYQTVIALES